MMRQINLLLILTGFLSSVSAQEKHFYNPFIDVQHYDFTIELTDANDEIKATAAITVAFTRATNTIEFDLINKNARGRGMTVIAVEENKKSLSFEHNTSKLKIKLINPANAGDTGTYKISYSGTPANGLVFGENKFKQRTIFGDNWPNRARNWLPCVDHLSDKASVDFSVIAPDHYAVISNGVLIEESALEGHKKFTHWRETVALPTKVMVIGLADFAIKYEGSVECIPVSSWVFPKDKKAGFYDYGQAMEILPFFINKLGPYAYKKLANVEAITIFGGMENASAIFYNEQSITGKRGYSEELIAHEIAHQWFGNSATESDWSHVWLSEGFATEMTDLYLENKYGADTLAERLKEHRQTVIDFARDRFTPIIDSSVRVNYLTLINTNSYKKGGWVLHMLRRKIGDTLFWKGLQSYYATYAGRNADTDDFRRVMESISGIDLKEFFQQWLFTPGHPVLKIIWQYDEKKKALMIRVTQLQKQLFSFPLEFAFMKGATAFIANQAFLVNEKMKDFEIPMTDKPSQVIADPATNLLFEGNIVEEKAL